MKAPSSPPEHGTLQPASISVTESTNPDDIKQCAAFGLFVNFMTPALERAFETECRVNTPSGLGRGSDREVGSFGHSTSSMSIKSSKHGRRSQWDEEEEEEEE